MTPKYTQPHTQMNEKDIERIRETFSLDGIKNGLYGRFLFLHSRVMVKVFLLIMRSFVDINFLFNKLHYTVT